MSDTAREHRESEAAGNETADADPFLMLTSPEAEQAPRPRLLVETGTAKAVPVQGDHPEALQSELKAILADMNRGEAEAPDANWRDLLDMTEDEKARRRFGFGWKRTKHG